MIALIGQRMNGTPTPINPFNDKPIVHLFDQGGTFLGHISQREAARLLRAGQGDLVLDVPPGVRLSIPTSDYQALAPSLPVADALKAELGRECRVPPHGLQGSRLDRRYEQPLGLRY